MILQHRKVPQEGKREPIPRLKKCELASAKLKEPEMKIFKRQKKPSMPNSHAQRGVLPRRILRSQSIMVARSEAIDFQFMKEILTQPSVPDFAGYNTKQMRESGQIMKTKSKLIFRPLINKTLSDPSTMLTAMCDIEDASHQAGQQVTVFTCDQQLYRVIMDIIWEDPVRWKHFYPRIGGMHWLMSFVGAVGKLMKNSGLDLLMKTAFAGVEKMLVGKKFPQHVRALRIVVIELLRPLIDVNTCQDDFTATLQELSNKSKLAEHWIQNLIYPVFIMMMHIRGEREGEFGLHLYACKKMIPYFFAAGHWNHARASIVYMRTMEKLPEYLVKKFMNGEHMVRIQNGLFNGIWSGMAIESSYMKVGKGPAGVIGVTTNHRSVSIWSNSHHLCGELLIELSDLGSKQQTHDPKHKEEGTGRIKSDADDRSKIRSALNKCIHPLLVETHASNVLVNIYIGEESTKSVNVNKAAEIGKKQIDEFQDNLPDAFRKTLTTKVVLMTSLKDKKTIQKAEKGDYNEDLIFSCVLLLLGTNQIDFKDVFNFELAAVPASLFYETGNARYPKNKSVLMNKLKVEESSRGIQFDSVIID